jgi:hypothetical protein
MDISWSFFPHKTYLESIDFHLKYSFFQQFAVNAIDVLQNNLFTLLQQYKEGIFFKNWSINHLQNARSYTVQELKIFVLNCSWTTSEILFFGLLQQLKIGYLAIVSKFSGLLKFLQQWTGCRAWPEKYELIRRWIARNIFLKVIKTHSKNSKDTFLDSNVLKSIVYFFANTAAQIVVPNNSKNIHWQRNIICTAWDHSIALVLSLFGGHKPLKNPFRTKVQSPF